MLKNIVNQSEKIGKRIEALPHLARVAIAVGSAQRLMNQYLKLPQKSRESFVISLAEVTCMFWKDLLSNSSKLNTELNKRLKQYYSGPNCHELGEQALPGADEDAASAAIYAIEAYCTGSSIAASRAAMQLLTEADARADAFSEANRDVLMSTNAEARRVQFQQIELNRLAAALTLLEQEGLNEDTVIRLGTILLDTETVASLPRNE